MLDRFQGLHCRPSDFAFIVQDVPKCQANIGQIVRVVSEYTHLPDEPGFPCLVEPQSCQPSPDLVGMPGTSASLFTTTESAPNTTAGYGRFFSRYPLMR